MNHLIVTACDARYGDFLTNHFLKSLTENVDLTNIDVVILDYGLRPDQVAAVESTGAKTQKCTRDAHIVNLRSRDMIPILDEARYDQVMSIDSGDVIFQADISEAFETDKDQIRATPEHIRLSLNDFFIPSLIPEVASRARKLLKNRLSLNCGVMIGPCRKIRKLALEAYSIISKKSQFGPDQVAFNYILYRDGFAELDPRFNFMPMSTSENFYIESGVFYQPGGLPIPIVHNAGCKDAFRSIRNFGYGAEHNKVKSFLLTVFRTLFNKSIRGSNELNPNIS